jgi:Flp pilus assembly protein TadG
MRFALDSVLARFGRDRRGVIAVTFAVSLLPLMAFTTAAVEYGRMTAQRARLQVAADTISLALAPNAFAKTEAQILAEANAMLQSLNPNRGFTAVAAPNQPVISTAGTEITLQIQAPFSPVFNFLQFGNAPVRALSTAAVANTTYEIALVIDNSGSMGASAGGDTKMQSAKTAANRLIDAMMATQRSASRTKFSVVPFTLAVKVGSAYRTESWMDRTGQSPIHYENVDTSALPSGYKPTRFDLFDNLGLSWAGCVETRPGDWAANDQAPTSGTPASLFVPMTAPDEPGNAGVSAYPINSWTYPNSYLSDNPKPECRAADDTGNSEFERGQRKFCKYTASNVVATQGGRGPNHGCIGQPLTRLTSDTTTLRNSINGMVADGNTNLLEGFTWGWRTISPNLPFANGRAYNADNNRKIIVFLTDGMNFWSDANNHNRSVYSPLGYYHNARLGTPAPTTMAEARAQMDAKTLQACNNAKAAPNNVMIYTVGFSVSSDPIDSAGLSLLRNCATSPTMAYVANNSDAIVTVFEEIQRAITGLRLAR